MGYDALQPFIDALDRKYMPYTHNWHNIAALECSLDMLLAEGLPQVFRRHQQCAEHCR